MLDATDTERAVVAGVCDGGCWALMLAADHPERVLAVAALAPAVPYLTPPHRHWIEADFEAERDVYEGWEKANRHSWRRDLRGWLEFYAVAELTRGELLSVEGAGHLPLARQPVLVNLALRDLVDRAAGPRPAALTWRRAHGRPRRALYVSSPIGLGHALRDYAIADELRRLVPGLEVDWLAQHPVTEVLAARGERIHPASPHLLSESAHWTREASGHELPSATSRRRRATTRRRRSSPTTTRSSSSIASATPRSVTARSSSASPRTPSPTRSGRGCRPSASGRRGTTSSPATSRAPTRAACPTGRRSGTDPRSGSAWSRSAAPAWARRSCVASSRAYPLARELVGAEDGRRVRAPHRPGSAPATRGPRRARVRPGPPPAPGGLRRRRDPGRPHDGDGAHRGAPPVPRLPPPPATSSSSATSATGSSATAPAATWTGGTGPPEIAKAIAAELGRDVSYREVEAGGAARAAALVADLIA